VPAPPDHTTLTLLLGRLARLNEAAVTDVCADHATTPAEVRVMSLLAHRPDGAASPSDIAAFVVQTSGGLTATLRRLETDGHVERVPDPHDGRGRLVVLTESGRAFHDRVIAAIVAHTVSAIGGLDLESIDTCVRALVEALETLQGLPSSAGFVAGSILDPTGSPT
jgi:DNA-binding MarR family transcriptional regulator